MREKRENKTKTQTNQYKQTNENKNNRTQQRSTYLNNPLCPLGLSPPPLSRGRCWRRQRHVRTGTPPPARPRDPAAGSARPRGTPFYPLPGEGRGKQRPPPGRVGAVRYGSQGRTAKTVQLSSPKRRELFPPGESRRVPGAGFGDGVSGGGGGFGEGKGGRGGSAPSSLRLGVCLRCRR